MTGLVSANYQFIRRIDEISSYVNNMMSNNHVWNSFEEFSLSPEQKKLLTYLQSAGEKTIQYNAVIISLYGCFENYIDSICSRYLDLVISGSSRFDSLPSKIQDNYLAKIGDYLINPNRSWRIDDSPKKVIDECSKALKSNISAINKAFLLTHSGNLKIDQICSFLNELGIENTKAKICSNSLFKSFFSTVVGVEEADYDLKVRRGARDLFSNLDDLVDHRNTVAHGWVEDNRMSVSDIQTYVIPFIIVLAQVLLRIIICESAKNQKCEDASCLFSRNPLCVFDNHILCLHISGQTVAVNDYVVYKLNNSTTKCAQIKRIEINKESLPSINSIDGDVGFELDDRISLEDQIITFVPSSS